MSLCIAESEASVDLLRLNAGKGTDRPLKFPENLTQDSVLKKSFLEEDRASIPRVCMYSQLQYHVSSILAISVYHLRPILHGTRQ